MRNRLVAILIPTILAVQGCGGCDDEPGGAGVDVGGSLDLGGDDVGVAPPDLGSTDVSVDTTSPVDLGADGPLVDAPSSDGAWTGDGPSADASIARECADVEPPAGPIGAPVLLLVSGDGFDLAGTQLELVQADPPNTVFPLSPVTVTNLDGGSDGEQASATIPANTLPQGLYDVRIITSGETLDCGSYYASAGSPPTVASVIADSASSASDRLVTITGTGFQPTPTVRFRLISDPKVLIDATQVDFVSSTSLTVLVPSNSLAMPLGQYHVFVRNPDLLGAQWCPTDGICVDADMNGLPDNAGVFAVTPLPPPDIFDATFAPLPASGCPETPRLESNCCDVDQTELKITGQNFDLAAEIALVVAPGSGCPMPETTPDPDDPDVCIVGPCSFCTATEIRIAMPLCTQAIYGVRVTNPDTQFDSFFVVEITSSSAGHINGPWDDASLQTQLVCGRERHAAVSGRDQTGQTHVWAIGGVVLDDPVEPEVCGGTTPIRVATDTVERAALSVFGVAGGWGVSEQYLDAANPRVPNMLQTPRSGLTAVRFGRRIYAIGGAANDTRDPAILEPALDSVETARILDWQGRPLVAAPTTVGGLCNPASEGCLPGGTWFYRVTGVSAEGESLGSVEASRKNVGGRLRLCWLPVIGASGYNIYRSLAEDGRSQSTRLLVAQPAMGAGPGQINMVNVGGANMACFLDNGGDLTATGGAFLVPAPGRLRGTVQTGGSLGDPGCAADATYRYRVQAVVENSLAASNSTLAGYEASLTIRAVEECSAGLRTAQLNWDALDVGGTGSTVTQYRIYRDQIPADPDPTRMGLLAVVAGSPPAATYADDGAVPFSDPNAAPPTGIATLPPGSLSRWTSLVEPMSGTPVTLTQPREGADAVVVTIQDRAGVDADRSFLFVAGGRTDNAPGGGNYLTTTERLELGADSVPLAATFEVVNAPGTMTPVDFSAPRAFFPLLTNNEHGEPAVPSDPCPNPDADGDGYISCLCPGGNDCDDTNANVHPGAGEICGNGIDEDCSGGCAGGDDLPCGTTPDMGVVPDGAEPPPDVGVPPDGAEPPPDGPAQADMGSGCVDNDGDGHENQGCGGDDCNDNDDTICPTCMEIPCDGIDQNCDFIDPPCWKPGEDQGAGHLGQDLTYLIALAGDDQWDNPDNGRTSIPTGFDYCTVDDDSSDDMTPGAPQVGDIVCTSPTVWSNQLDNPGSQDNYAHDGILYADYIYMFGGATTELAAAVDPSTDGNSFRWQFCEDTADMNCGTGTPIDDQRQNAGANFAPGRAYFALIRAASKLWVIGGNEGAGPVSTILRHDQ